MKPEELFDCWLEGAIDRRRQVDALGVHLTVAEILSAHTRGRVDFGGSEMAPALLHSLIVTDHKPGDKFGWWRLDEGTYVVRFNEKLREGAPPALLISSGRLLE